MMAADYLLFDVVDPLQSKSASAARNRAKEWFATFQGPIGYEIRDLQISAANGVGYSHGLNHVSATKLDGNPLDMWWRATLGLRQLEGQVDDHSCAQLGAFDTGSGKASLDLKP